MKRTTSTPSLLITVVGLLVGLSLPSEAMPVHAIRQATQWYAVRTESGSARDRAAKQRRLATVKQMFSKAGVAYPPAQVLLRVYKKDEQLEVWANGRRREAMKKVATYEICSQGDGLGPKLRQGDGKTPEGFYRLDFYNKRSSYHLSMRVNYPNQLDRQLKRTGSAIMIHGACVSIGCLAMSDQRIEELWVIAREASRRSPVAVHIYPGRDLAGLIRQAPDAQLQTFWTDLKAGHDAFEATKTLPHIAVRAGRYVMR